MRPSFLHTPHFSPNIRPVSFLCHQALLPPQVTHAVSVASSVELEPSVSLRAFAAASATAVIAATCSQVESVKEVWGVVEVWTGAWGWYKCCHGRHRRHQLVRHPKTSPYLPHSSPPSPHLLLESGLGSAGLC